jgi:hypothetical protein
MRKIILLIVLLFSLIGVQAQHLKKDGTPDMRFKENKRSSSFSTPNTTTNTNTDVRIQNGYQKDNGTIVEPHYKTNNNQTNLDNFSTKDNSNPYTGQSGTKAKDFSQDASNYGNGKTIQEGPKGGQFYINDKGSKTYVPKQPK